MYALYMMVNCFLILQQKFGTAEEDAYRRDLTINRYIFLYHVACSFKILYFFNIIYIYIFC